MKPSTQAPRKFTPSDVETLLHNASRLFFDTQKACATALNRLNEEREKGNIAFVPYDVDEALKKLQSESCLMYAQIRQVESSTIIEGE